AHEVVGGAGALAAGRQVQQEGAEGRAVGEEQRVVVEAEAAAGRYGAGAAALAQHDQRLVVAVRAQGGLDGLAVEDAHARHALGPGERALEVGELQAHAAEARGGGQAVAAGGDAHGRGGGRVVLGRGQHGDSLGVRTSYVITSFGGEGLGRV